MKYIQVYALFLLFVFTSCNGQVKKDLPKEKEHQKLIKTISDPQFGTVRCSLQDNEGNLWFGTTEKGLYKYDGKSFKQFTVNDGLDCNKIYCILEDKDGKIWIGTEIGLCFYNGKTFDKIQIPLPKNLPPNKNPHYQNHWVYSMLQAKNGKLWFVTIDGVYIYDGKSFTHFPMNEAAKGFLTSNDKVERILEDNAGNIWLGGRTNEGVFRYDGKSITNFNLQELIQGPNGRMPKPHSWGWPQLQDKNGNLWFSNWGGAYRYDGKTFTGFSAKDGLTGTMIAKIIEDKMGNIWFSGDGLFRYDWKSIAPFTTKDGLANLGGWSILEDTVGNLWVGTKEKGLYIFDGKEFITYSEFKQ
jgi:ligand-binding sensor domain-containing protein